MKTIEEKAKAYDEALERAKQIRNGNPSSGTAIVVCEQIFPELRESEDERINKAIFKALSKKEARDVLLAEGVQVSDALAYLEKQKEQIPYIDFVIKPHKGDDNNPYDMRVSEAQEYAIKRGFGIPFNDGEVFVDERYITQTIGNILRWADEHPKEQKPRIEICPHSIKSKSYRENGVPTESISDELIDIIKGEFEGFRTLLKKKGIDYEPQRSYWEAFARLFDSSAREYVKEQKPVDEQFEEWLNAWYQGSKELGGNVVMSEEEFKNWSRGIKNMYDKPAEWSEEDEEMLEYIIGDVNDAKQLYRTQEARDMADKEIAWLKSLRPQPKREWSEKDKQWLSEVYFAIDHSMYSEVERQAMKKYIDYLRYQSRPEQEWSEEDEKKREQVIKILEQANENWRTAQGSVPFGTLISWLKSIRPSWKPSEEQLKELNFARLGRTPNVVHEHLDSLYNDLLKLKQS